MHAIKTITIAALLVAAAAVPGYAEDAMAPNTGAMGAMAPNTDAMGAMAPNTAMGAMAPHDKISDADLDTCLKQAATITFPEAMTAATIACNCLHEGMDVVGALRSMGMDPKMEANPMAGGAMTPAM